MYLGEDQMLGIVCTNFETAFSLEKYDENGKVDLQNAVYAKAAELGKSISREFRVICLEEIRYKSGNIFYFITFSVMEDHIPQPT